VELQQPASTDRGFARVVPSSVAKKLAPQPIKQTARAVKALPMVLSKRSSQPAEQQALTKLGTNLSLLRRAVPVGAQVREIQSGRARLFEKKT
jgi:hypothetical protein